jgi:hypothetical protein
LKDLQPHQEAAEKPETQSSFAFGILERNFDFISLILLLFVLAWAVIVFISCVVLWILFRGKKAVIIMDREEGGKTAREGFMVWLRPTAIDLSFENCSWHYELLYVMTEIIAKELL